MVLTVHLGQRISRFETTVIKLLHRFCFLSLKGVFLSVINCLVEGHLVKLNLRIVNTLIHRILVELLFTLLFEKLIQIRLVS